jgi:hypothetical protein
VYIGHVGIALALRSHRSAPPLWVLMLSAQGPDWLDAFRGLRGIPTEHATWSMHSIPHVAIGAAVAALGALVVALAARRGDTADALHGAALAALAYYSHWVADFFTGIKPTWPGGPYVGLQWYLHPWRDLLLETAVVAVAWWIWRRSLADRRNPLAWALLGALLALQVIADVVMARGTPLI